MRDNDSLSGPVDCADQAAAVAAGTRAWRAVRAAGAGTLVVGVGDGAVATLRFVAGETQRVNFANVSSGAGVFPVTLFT